MIPVRDAIPTRTRPAVTLALAAAMGAALAWAGVREWWLPWTANAVVVWLAGSTVEDRFGHGRFAAFAAACAASAMAAQRAGGQDIALIWTASGGAAGVVAAYLVMFPHSRVLLLVPVAVGLDLADVPAWVIVGLWAAVQAAAAWSALTWGAPVEAAGLAVSLAAGAAAGALGGLLLPRSDRMRVDWWDPPTRRS